MKFILHQNKSGSLNLVSHEHLPSIQYQHKIWQSLLIFAQVKPRMKIKMKNNSVLNADGRDSGINFTVTLASVINSSLSCLTE